MIESPDVPDTTIRIAAAIMLNERNQMLLVRKHGTRAFMQPGGKIEPGEAPAAALSRELKEELSVDVDPDDLRYLGRFAAPAANEPNCNVETEVFEVRFTPCTPTPAAEIEEILWFGLEPADEIVLAPLTRDEILPRCLAARRRSVVAPDATSMRSAMRSPLNRRAGPDPLSRTRDHRMIDAVSAAICC